MPRETHNIFELKLVIKNLRIAVGIVSFFLAVSFSAIILMALENRELQTRLEMIEEFGQAPIIQPQPEDILPNYPVEDAYAFDQYIATTEWEANAIAENLVHGATVENVCGPLSIQLLKDMGYVYESIPIKDFWFLRPWDENIQKNVIVPAFPQSYWIWEDGLPFQRIATSITKYDFNKYPLKEGDFIFLPYNYQCGGTFAHMLTVTKVEDGIPYTITNYQTQEGWRIEEVPLYGVDGGLFEFFTDKSHEQTIGTTGFCGFYLWRQGK